MQILTNLIQGRYHRKSQLIMSLSLLLTFFLLFVINQSDSTDFEYVCVVDAGSTGSRIHVYKYRPPEPGQQLIWVDVKSEEYKKFYPGLSSFEDKPTDLDAMASYFKPILNFGREHVPAAKRASTAFFVLASAGMRKVRERNTQTAQRIMDTAYKHLAESSEFIVHREGIKIIEGRNEGLWGWMAANYLNGELGKLLTLGSDAVYSRQTTKGIVEMGGESLQITFIPRESALETVGSEHIESISIGNVEFKLFSHSWMGIGMEAAQSAYDSYLSAGDQKSESPCYNRGVERSGNAGTWTGNGDFQKCYNGLTQMMTESLKPQCHIPKGSEKQLVCTPNQILMPAIDSKLEAIKPLDFYYIENFYYTAKVLGLLNIHGLPFLKALKEKGNTYCSMERAEAVKAFPDADDDEIDKTCFCSAWLLTILEEGFSLRQFDHFKVIRDIEGEGNIDWALGFIVAEVPAINAKQRGYEHPLDAEKETNTVVVGVDGSITDGVLLEEQTQTQSMEGESTCDDGDEWQ